MHLVEILFDHPDLFLIAGLTGAGIAAWWWLGRGDEWVVVAHRMVRGLLAVAAVVVVAQCAQAANGGGPRVGSATVAIRAGEKGVAVLLDSTPIDPDRVPSSRLLNQRGLTSVESLDGGLFGWAAMTGASFEIPIASPPANAALAVLISGAVSLLPWFVGLLAIERILRRARRGDPFSRGNVRDLRWLAAALSVFVYLANVVDYVVAKWVSSDAGVGLSLGAYQQMIGIRLDFSLMPFVAGALVLALTEVWRSGMELREEAEATI